LEDLTDDTGEIKQQPGEDTAELLACEVLADYFDSHKGDVFFSRQLEVIFERAFFHWITNRALRKLAAQGRIVQTKASLLSGGSITLYWHRTLRYYARPSKNLIDLVSEYSKPDVSGAIGIQGETLVLEGFVRNHFLYQDRSTNENGNLKWTETAHDLDFIFHRDGLKYGIEVKNTLGYMQYDEFKLKIALCFHIGVIPVFVARMMPGTWILELQKLGGFALILQYQLYPWGFKDLCKRVRDTLSLPVDSPRALADGTMKRFTDWHMRNL
jgi:hypothetical protein